MQDLIEYLAKYLVDRPEEIEVRETTGESTVVYGLRAGDGGLGKIIGKRGPAHRPAGRSGEGAEMDDTEVSQRRIRQFLLTVEAPWK